MIEEILRLKVTNFTRLKVGWYEPNIMDPIGLRPTELKGIWRWWARAFACGVLYDGGSNPSPSDLVKIVGKDLGLGYAGGVNIGGKSAMPSKYIIRVNETFEPTNFKKAKFYTISLFSTESNSDKKAAAVLSFLSAIMLMGIGKRGRRGQGSLDVKKIEKEPEINGKKLVEMKVKDLVVETYKYFSKLDSIKDAQSKENPAGDNLPKFPLPKFPCLSTKQDVASIHHLEARDDSRKPPLEVFKNVINSFNLRKEYEWFLGMPRKGKYKELRRPSPIILTAHGNNIFGNGAFLTVLASADWPNINDEKKQISPEQIRKAKDEFVKYLEEYCSNEGYKPKKIWPQGEEDGAI